MRKLNCWEFKNCGRERGGVLTPVQGECPVASSWSYDGTNEGIAGGRVCWQIKMLPDNELEDNICRGSDCKVCEFRRRVLYEGSVPSEMPVIPSTVA